MWVSVPGSRNLDKTAIILTMIWVNYDWLVVYLPLWKMMEFVSWDDETPNIWKIKNVPNHQPDQPGCCKSWNHGVSQSPAGFLGAGSAGKKSLGNPCFFLSCRDGYSARMLPSDDRRATLENLSKVGVLENPIKVISSKKAKFVGAQPWDPSKLKEILHHHDTYWHHHDPLGRPRLSQVELQR